MRLVKPSWVEHTAGEKKTKGTVYSLSVHPDGTRLATGGVDRKIKIWSTLPILDSAAEKVEANHKLLCAMSEHTGAVLTVRWAHHGRYLASGSDDQVGMIWGLDPDGGGRLWGSDEVNVENWKPLKRLVAHVADIIDMAWSRDDTMLASVGLDSTVWIWDGLTFERIKKLDKHVGSVKGVCWDPVGNFLATQSDDKTVKIWNTDTWELLTSVSEPFENSGLSTFFRRLSWSPDGAFIAASNAKNGPIFVSAVIDRDVWTSTISFVGHANTIQVAAFNPRLFFPPDLEPKRATASCMLALGADDFSISIWSNISHIPIVVLHNLFENALMDLCWSNDGHHLYGCSEDGTICAISFNDPEIPNLGTPEQTDSVLKEYNYQPLNRRIAPPLPSGTISNGFGSSSSSTAVVNIIRARKSKPGDQRRRINFSKTNPTSSGMTNNSSSTMGGGGGPSRAPLAPPRASSPGPPTPRANGNYHEQSMFDAPIEDFASPSQAQASTARMFENANSAFGAGGAGRSSSPTKLGTKRRGGSLLDDRGGKGRMMSSGKKTAVDVVELRPARTGQSSTGSRSTARSLPLPTIQSVLRVKPSQEEESGEKVYLEVRNAKDNKGKNMVVFNRDGEDVWVDYVPSPVVSLSVGRKCSAVGCENGVLIINSAAGRHLLDTKLPSLPIDISISGNMVGSLTSNSEARVYNIKTSRFLALPTSTFHLLQPESATAAIYEIKQFATYSSGACSIITSEPSAYALDINSSTWIPLITPFQISGSTILTTRSPGGSLARIETEVIKMFKGKTIQKSDKPEWFDESLISGHLEMRIKGADVLGSHGEWCYWVEEYTKFVGEKDFRERAGELVKDLIGLSTGVKRVEARKVLDILSGYAGMREVVDRYETILEMMED